MLLYGGWWSESFGRQGSHSVDCSSTGLSPSADVVRAGLCLCSRLEPGLDAGLRCIGVPTHRRSDLRSAEGIAAFYGWWKVRLHALVEFTAASTCSQRSY